MRRVRTSSRIARAHGRASSYVVKAIGARPPSEWQLTQRASTSRLISPSQVTFVETGSCARRDVAAMPSTAATSASRMLLTAGRRRGDDGAGGDAIDRVDERREHHLFPRLIAPLHVDLRVGIGFVAGRVVVVGDSAN